MWGRLAALSIAAVVLHAGCLQSNTVVCADGRVCPAGYVCHGNSCAAGAQLDACAGKADRAPCDYVEGGVCIDGVCTAAFCGDGLVMAPEECEDGQLGSVATCQDLGYYAGGAIQCNARCEYERGGCTEYCGDATVQTDAGEQCEAVGEVVSDCITEGYYYAGDVMCNEACRYNLSNCSGRCGDGVLDPTESCEQGVPYTDSCLSFGYDAGSLGCRLCGPAFDDCMHLSWRRMQNETFDDMVAISGNGGRIVGLTRTGTVIDRVGTAWEVTHTLPAPVVQGDRWRDLLVVAPNDVYAVGSTGAWHDNGSSWTAIAGAPATKYHGIARSSAGLIYLGTNAGIYTYDGATFTLLPGSVALIPVAGVVDKIEFFVPAANDLYVIVRRGTVSNPGWDDGDLWHYNGVTWSQPAGTAFEWQTVWGSSADDIYVGGRQLISGESNDVAVVAHFDGVTWTSQPLPGNANPAFQNHAMIALWGSAPGDVYGVISDVGVVRYDGSRWTLSGAALTAHSLVWGTGPGEVFAAGRAGAIDRYQGATWRAPTDKPAQAPSPPPQVARYQHDVWGASPDDIWFSSYDGLWRWLNGSWVEVRVTNADNSTVGALYNLFGLSASNVYAGGPSGVYQFNGTSWTRVYVPPRQVTAMWGSASDDVWAVGVAGSFPTTPPLIVRWDGVA